MADELSANEEVNMLSQKLETQRIATNDTNPNFHDNMNCYKNKYLHKHINKDTKSMQLPAVNLPEKILIVIDITRENNGTRFEFGNGEKKTPLQVIARAVEIFIRTKNIINPKHEYALMIISTESAEIICNFTSDETHLLGILYGIKEFNLKEEPQETWNLAPTFDDIAKFLTNPDDVYPLFVNRVILIYTRSNSIPVFSVKTQFRNLMRQKYFFFDALFVHEPLGENNASEKVYTALSELDVNQNSWIFEVGRSAAQLHTAMAKLLAHPLQRPKQDCSEYKVFSC